MKKSYFAKHRDTEAYTRAYHEQVLDKLSAEGVYADLKDSTILCWEKSGEFCHRNLGADWLKRELGVDVEGIR